MKIDKLIDNLWYVHTDSGLDSIWTHRREARAQKRTLKAQGTQKIRISFVPVNYGTIKTDSHS